MTDEQVSINYDNYIKYLRAYLKGTDGLDKLVEYLNGSDLKVAPASTKYHMAERGGLVQHSLNVFNNLISLIKMKYGDIDKSPFSKRTIALVALLHDVSKIGLYKESFRNAKDDATGEWKKVACYVTADSPLLYSTHEVNSVYILNQFIPLTYEEQIAILYHSGAYSAKDEYAIARLSMAFETCPLALLLHEADMLATYFDESKHGKEDKA